VKLLFDENLSPKLVGLLERDFPGSRHVEDLELRGSADEKIWTYARENGFTIVSKDTDFQERSALEGAPPKVIWLGIGNAGTRAVADLLIRSQTGLVNFDTDTEASILVLPLEAEGGRTSR